MESSKSSRSTEKIVNALSHFANSIGMVVLILMMLLTVADVFLRFGFNKPILGTVELCEYMMVAVVYLALPLCAVREKNVRVEILAVRLPPKLLAFVDVITCFLSLGILALITWQGFLEFNDMFRVKRVSNMLSVPAYPFHLILAVSSLILCGVLLIKLIQMAREAVKS
jgi:TRAP-type C4-dicarboxylate transport system permease small subunit